MTILGFTTRRRRFAIEIHPDWLVGWNRYPGEWCLVFLGFLSIVWERP